MSEVFQCPMDEIYADEQFNCRGHIAPFDVVDLVQDIENVAETVPDCPSGLLQPITISSIEQPTNGKRWSIIAGFRRYTAFKVIGRKQIPAIIINNISDMQKRFLNIRENLKRSDLNILQEAKAMHHFKKMGIPETQVMKELGATRGWVQVRYMLLELPEEIQEEAAKGNINQTHIRDLYTIKDNKVRFEAVKAIKERAERSGGKRPLATRITQSKNYKRARNKGEMVAMQELIYNAIGNNLMTRTLAWAAGEIDDRTIHQEIKKLADSMQKPYSVPELK